MSSLVVLRWWHTMNGMRLAVDRFRGINHTQSHKKRTFLTWRPQEGNGHCFITGLFQARFCIDNDEDDNDNDKNALIHQSIKLRRTLFSPR